jgi:hypothetical protein
MHTRQRDKRDWTSEIRLENVLRYLRNEERKGSRKEEKKAEERVV